MSLSMYSSSIPVLLHYLRSLDTLLAMGGAHASEGKIDEKALTAFRLYPDMFPFSRQVQIACDTAKGCGARLAGREVPAWEDSETTFAELRERTARTIAFLETLPEEAFTGCEERPIHFKAGPREQHFIGRDYLPLWVFPNFYFHLTTAYNILRHNGVAVGKQDFLRGGH